MKVKFNQRLFGILVLIVPVNITLTGNTFLPVNLQDTTKNKSEVIPKAVQSVTQHKLTAGGINIPYTATAGTLIVRNEKDLPYASMGYFAYIRNDVTDPNRRPITFAYNGGPGCPSIWLNMGALGAKRIITNDPSFTPPPPYKVIDNVYSILDKTDLVMIDAVGTGISRAVGESKDKDFWSVDADIESFARFIRQYITENGRWNSPKYLLGESYGTTRSAGIVDYLQCNEGMSFNGVILVSLATNLEMVFDDWQGYDYGVLFTLPTYTAVAWYHKVLPDPPSDIGPFLKEVSDFTLGEYSKALAQGNNLADSVRKKIIDKLHLYTGISKEYIDKADLRIPSSQFANQLLNEHREALGFLDARFTGISFDPLDKKSKYDPSDAATGGAFTAAFLDHLHRDLKFNPEKTYLFFNADANKAWDFRHQIPGEELPQPLVNTGIDLEHAMGYNPNLKVLVLQGTYDLTTTFLATEYMVSHLKLRKDLRSNIEIKYYDAGHMMYIHEPSLKKFKNDIATFIDQTSRQ
jgi:carboxypeptidase C (cathepsin A)